MNATLKDTLALLHNDESGATATEYIILLTLIACFVIGIVKVFGTTVSQKYDDAMVVVRDEVTF